MMRAMAALGIGIAAAGLIATNAVLYDTAVDISPATPTQRSGTKLQDGAAPITTVPDMSGLAETFERPLFSPTRRKFVPAPAEPKPAEVATAPAAPSPQETAAPVAAPSLLGISISVGNARALLRVDGGAAANWYANGETVDGWTVSAIDKDEAVLTRSGREARLSLYPPVQKQAIGGGGVAQ
ncbi:hypothetical protein EJ071_37960 [Mesorhizobium sp. M1B.F.Ca.ET.045.04.1.1]|nr:hypothetical protein EJ071_37960 [Mesorhizobium sp. M1B.F.Ca.ET.045.04.1.1]